MVALQLSRLARCGGLASHAFNYSLLGRLGFELTAALIDACQCWDFGYSDLADGLAALEGLRS